MVEETSKLGKCPIKLVKKANLRLLYLGWCRGSTSQWRWCLSILKMNNRITKSLIFLLHILKVTKTSSIGATIYFLNIDMIMNIMKYDTNKRWVIHNFNQQDMGNLQYLKFFYFTFNSKKNLTLKWLINAKIDVNPIQYVQIVRDMNNHKNNG